MPDEAHLPPSYAFRSILFRRERRFTLTPDALLVQGGRRDILLRYADIASVRLYLADLRASGPVDRCDLRAPGHTIRLQSAHVGGPADLQDRRASFEPFVWQLVRRINDANPDARVMAGSPGSMRFGWMFALAVLVASALGGLALLIYGEWSGLWLVIMALGATPRVLAMLTRKPARRLGGAHIAASSGYPDLLDR